MVTHSRALNHLNNPSDTGLPEIIPTVALTALQWDCSEVMRVHLLIAWGQKQLPVSHYENISWLGLILPFRTYGWNGSRGQERGPSRQIQLLKGKVGPQVFETARFVAKKVEISLHQINHCMSVWSARRKRDESDTRCDGWQHIPVDRLYNRARFSNSNSARSAERSFDPSCSASRSRSSRVFDILSEHAIFADSQGSEPWDDATLEKVASRTDRNSSQLWSLHKW